MDEKYWWAIATIRTEDLHLISGGFSALCFYLFQALLDLSLGHLFKIKERDVFLSGHVKSIIMDEAALHAALNCKGSSGQKPCYKCGNIVSKQFQAKNPTFATLNAASTQLQLMSNQNIVGVLLLLQRQERVLSRSKFADLEKNLGWKLSTPSFLLDDTLSRTFSPSIFCFDPMHIFYQTGVASTAVGLIRNELTKNEYKFDDIFEHYSPRSFAGFTLHGYDKIAKSFLRRVMSDVYFTTDHCWRAGAAVHLTVIPLLALYIEMIILPAAEPRLAEHCQNFLQLALALGFYHVMKILPTGQNNLEEWGRSTMKRYVALYDQYLLAFDSLYGKKFFRPKHHYAHHLLQNWEVNKQIIDCFCLERKHRMSKSKMNNLKDLRTVNFCKAYLFAASVDRDFWISNPQLCLRNLMPPALRCNMVLWSPSENWCGIIVSLHHEQDAVECQKFDQSQEHFLWFRKTDAKIIVQWSSHHCYVCHWALKDDLLRLLI
eukprot:Skav206845  [mRNA]  locus=scaffold637:376546:378009:- [translate_table: standard]